MTLGTPANYWWVIPAVGFLSALFGAGAAFCGLVWRYRADYRRDIVRELLTAIQTAADNATDFWLLDPSKGGEAPEKARALAARILGHSERLDASIEAARPHLRAIDTLGMDKPWSALLDDLTGGEFSDPTRAADLLRAENVQISAAILIRELRAAADRRMLTSL